MPLFSIQTSVTVHPHVCGENFKELILTRARPGSPPRVWGKRFGLFAIIQILRFTPTCVGKTSRGGNGKVIHEVHPHVCGENNTRAGAIQYKGGSPPRVWGKREYARPSMVTQGSPPRVWGKRAWPGLDFVSRRFTPTCVGKTQAVTACGRR